MRKVSAAAVAVCLVLLIGVFSQFPVAATDTDDALLRLTWRLRSQETGECPSPTDEELERLPVHMRNPDACIGPLPAYDFEVRLDGEVVMQEVVTARGARGDRPLYVLDDLWLAPGSYRIQVEFRRQDEPGQGVIDMGQVLSIDTEVVLEASTVTLVTRAGDTGNLEVRRPR